MNEAIKHRGPDSDGYWTDPPSGVAFAHRRLAILDLSPDGYQPMRSASGRFDITFNGEVYNFQELRSELARDGFTFRGGSDTEVMLAAFEKWGVHDATCRFNGMFAFAVWDHREQTLHLVRDRIGIKPLYYGWTSSGLAFGSEVGVFRKFPGFDGTLSVEAVRSLIGFGFIAAPHSVYRDVYKLPAGTILTLPRGEMYRQPSSFSPVPEGGGAIAPRRYWSLREVAERGQASPLNGSAEEISHSLETLLSDSVKLMMIADVPVGAFLSGGVDSSVIVSLMQRLSSRPVETFSIGFDVAEYDESEFARNVAKALGTEHHELRLSASEVMSAIPWLLDHLDEPIADSSLLPTYLVSKLARGRVTVSLSGDGGDELFMGYNRYLWSEKVWRMISSVPQGVRGLAGGIASKISTSPLAQGLGMFGFNRPAEKLQKLAGLCTTPGMDELYVSLLMQWPKPELVVPNSAPRYNPLDQLRVFDKITSFPKRAMAFDQSFYLVDDLLSKLDRATMAVALEGRVPFLDHRVIELAARVPAAACLLNGQSKGPLRAILYRHLPRELVDRPKMGFSVPIGAWLRGGLREWGEELLSEKSLASSGLLDPAPVCALWDKHLRGDGNWQHQLWNVLVFQSWIQSATG